MDVQFISIYALLGLSTILNIIVPVSGSAIVTPLLTLLTNPHQAIGIASFFFFLSAIPRIFFFRKSIQWGAIKTLLFPSIVAASCGAFALMAIPELWVLVIILGFSIYFLLKKLNCIKKVTETSKILNHFIGVLSGFLQGTGLTGSDLRNQYLFGKGFSLAQVHGTTAFIGASNFLVATLVRLHTEQLTIPVLTPLFYIFPIIILATWIGKKIIYKLSQKKSDLIIISVMIFIIVSLTYQILTWFIS
jgi:uncharacterized membrane protein YfcA